MARTAVIVPVFNGERFLADALHSIAAQSDSDWECVIVDDGSTDGSVAIIGEFAQRDSRFRVVTQNHGGVSAARNRGFRAISLETEYVAALDCDDLWLPNALETLHHVLSRDPSAIGAHCAGRIVTADGEQSTKEESWRRHILTDDQMGIDWRTNVTDFAVVVTALPPPIQGAVLVRRHTVEQAGPWDERFSMAEDWEMLVRLTRTGDLVHSDDVVVLYRMHEANRTGRNDYYGEMYRVRSKVFYSPDNTDEQRHLVRRAWLLQERCDLKWWWASAMLDLSGRRRVRRRFASAAIYMFYSLLALAGCVSRRPLVYVKTEEARW